MNVVSTLDFKNLESYLNRVHTLGSNDVLHVYDVFDQDRLDCLLTKGQPKYILGDHYSWCQDGEFTTSNLYVLPLFAARDAVSIARSYNFDNSFNTSCCFNFMANKHRVNRFLCIKLVEFFKLNDFDYTWWGIKRHFDMTKILNELDTLGSSAPFDNEVRSYLLGPIALEKRWITHDYQVELDYAVTNYGGNEWTWKNGLDKLFLNSATSLITEPVSYQKVALFTEKTLYSVFGLNFPIWIGGGYNQANEWKKIGFDVFDDVIDHSYQSYDSLIERCYYAFFYNRELLSNKSYAKKMRLQCKNRLLNNRQLLFDNQIKKFIDFEIAKFPIELQQTIPKILKRFGI